MEVKPWALIPLAVISGLFVLLYWWMWTKGRRFLATMIAHIERRHNITVTYGLREVKLVGRLSPAQRVGLGLFVFLLHFAAAFGPLLVTGCAVFLVDSFIPQAVLDAIRK